MSGVAHYLNRAAAGFLAAVLLFPQVVQAHKVHDPVAGTAPPSYYCPPGSTLKDFYVNASTGYRGGTPDAACFAWGDAQSPASHGHITYTHGYVAATGSSTSATGRAGICNVYWNPFGEHGGNLNASSDIRYQCEPPTTPSCAVPAGQWFSGAYTYTSGSVCMQNCNATSTAINIGAAASGLPTIYQFRSLGTSCGANTTNASPIPETPVTATDPDEPLNIACTGSMDNCVIPMKPNCGYVNGEFRCLGTTLQQGGCAELESGAVMCTSDAPVETLPNNGTLGQPATPDRTWEQSVDRDAGTMTTINYYNSTTTQNSTNYGGGDGNGDGEVSCGGPGQPQCRVDIDETGTPTSSGIDSGDDPDWSGMGDQLEGASGTGHLDGWNPAEALPEVPSGSCETIEVTFVAPFTGQTIQGTFPTPMLCTLLDKIKAAIGFVLVAFTVFSIAKRGLNAAGGT